MEKMRGNWTPLHEGSSFYPEVVSSGLLDDLLKKVSHDTSRSLRVSFLFPVWFRREFEQTHEGGTWFTRVRLGEEASMRYLSAWTLEEGGLVKLQLTNPHTGEESSMEIGAKKICDDLQIVL